MDDFLALVDTANIADPENSPDRRCAICCDKFHISSSNSNVAPPAGDTEPWLQKSNEFPVRLSYGHVFGESCIRKWLRTADSCPLCRARLTRDSQTSETLTAFVSNGRAYLQSRPRDTTHLAFIAWAQLDSFSTADVGCGDDDDGDGARRHRFQAREAIDRLDAILDV